MRAPFVSLLALVCSCGPSQECRTYVQCQQALDDGVGGVDVDVSAYDEGGSCWGLPQSAQQCTAICGQALAALRALPDPPAVCLR